MNHKLKIFDIVFISVCFAAVLNSCKKEEVPIVFTSPAITNITGTTATSGGKITDEGTGPVFERGVCWSTNLSPTIKDDKSISGSGAGAFQSDLSDLKEATVYYVRAFAINDAGVGYGVSIPFKTRGNIPSATTLSATNVSTKTGILNAEINANYLPTSVFFEYGPTTEYGNTILIPENPFFGNTDTIICAYVTELNEGTIYHFRVKTTNSLGTAYGNDMSFITLASDVDGNLYDLVSIGSQLWMAENLKTTKYNDGKPIPNVTDGLTWAGLKTPGYCWFNNDIKYKEIYGALYNWYTVKTGKLCPDGWHVPTDDEWHQLVLFLDSDAVMAIGEESATAGNKLKEAGTVHWASPNEGATNESGFTALPGGCRKYDGVFSGTSGHGDWRTSTEYDETQVMYRYIYYHSPSLYRKYTNKQAGYSVRCLRNN